MLFASLLLVKHRVVDAVAFAVCPGLSGDPGISISRHHDPRHGGFLAAALHHDFVRAGVNFRERGRIAKRVVALDWVILAVKLANAFPMLSLAVGTHDIDREPNAALKSLPFGDVAFGERTGTVL